MRSHLVFGLLGVVAVTASELLSADDECHSGDGVGGESCALNMLKRRIERRTKDLEEESGSSVEQRSESIANQTWQSTRLQVTNGCHKEPMWIAHMVGAGIGHDAQNIKLMPSASHDFFVSNGMSSTRYWPKLGCNAQGEDCRIGQSGGPGQSCPAKGCGPPIDSKFEATFGTVGAICDTAHGQIAGCDWLDVSLVDGFTTPFKVEVLGNCGGHKGVDCSGLQLALCPADLLLREPHTEALGGCYSPCAKKTYSHWGNAEGRHQPWDAAAKMDCCPTPPVSPKMCQAGTIAQSPYVKMVHARCPGVYGYAYDDAEGLSVCTSGVQYHVTFFCAE